jgi:hypothetical protein
MAFAFDGDQFIQVEEKKSWLSENRAKVMAASLTLLAAVLNLFGRWPKAIWALGVLSGMLLLWFIGSGILALTRRIFRKHDDKEYIAREYPRLVQLFEQFKRMTSRENTRAFRYMLYNASAYRVDVVDQILGSDYIEGWMACFEVMLADRCNSVRDFLARSGHFTALVREFNGNYVIKTQKAIEKNLTVPDHNIDDFEDFRERFGVYLHEVEQWAEKVSKEAQPRVLGPEFLQFVPQRAFERAKSFKKKTVAAVGA